jgi:hypothetical protein
MEPERQLGLLLGYTLAQHQLGWDWTITDGTGLDPCLDVQVHEDIGLSGLRLESCKFENNPVRGVGSKSQSHCNCFLYFILMISYLA